MRLMFKNAIVVTGLSIYALFSLANESSLPRFYANFSNIVFFDTHNEKFNFNSISNKITLFNFIYTSCATVCSVQTKQLATVYESLDADIKADIRFVSISLDPENDKATNLNKYVNRLNADYPGWYFLGTDFLGIRALSSKLVLFKEDYGKTVYEYIAHTINGTNNNQYKLEEHATNLWLIDTKGTVRQKYQGAPVDRLRLTKELKQLHTLEFKKR